MNLNPIENLFLKRKTWPKPMGIIVSLHKGIFASNHIGKIVLGKTVYGLWYCEINDQTILISHWWQPAG